MKENSEQVLQRFTRPERGRRGLGFTTPPPPELLGRPGFEDLAAALAEIARLYGELRAAEGEAKRLEEERPAAHTRDREALAETVRTGGKDPGPVEIDTIEAGIRAARRRMEACQLAVAAAIDDLAKLCPTRRNVWAAQTDKLHAEAWAAYAQAVADLDRVYRRLVQEEAFASWVAALPIGEVFRSRVGVVDALGDVAWPKVVEALAGIPRIPNGPRGTGAGGSVAAGSPREE